MAKKIGDTLRESRIKAGLSVEQISSILTQKGYKASIKTIYSWENGNSSPGPDALLEMCDIYKIHDILTAFGYNGYREDGSLQPNLNEIELIEKYRNLDEHGKDLVNTILEKENTRCFDFAISKTNDPLFLIENDAATSPIDRLAAYANAAHAIPNASPEDKQHDEDIMDAPDF